MRVKLKDIAVKITDGSHNPPQGIDSSPYVMISSKNIDDDCITLTDPRYLTAEDHARENQRTSVTENDVLMTIVGTVGRVAVVSSEHSGICLQRSVAVIKPKKETVIPRYLMYMLQSLRVHFEQEAHGVAQKGIYLKQLEETPVTLVDLPTQERIAAVLDKVSGLIAMRKKQLQKLDDLVKSRFVEMFGDPKYNKNNLVKIGEIGALTSGGTPSRAKPEYFEGAIRWYSAGELNSLYLADSIEHISETALQESSAKLFNKGTLLIGMYDTAAFKMGILTENASSNQACANLNPNQGYNIVWLYYLFDMMKPIFLKERQGVRQKNLSLSKIKEFEIPIAPFELQEDFTAFVKQTDKSKLTIQQSLDKLELMKKALMQKYFG